jgi:hypothetical protein
MDIKMLPPRPPVELPVDMTIVPEEPELEVPVVNLRLPVVPAVPAFTLIMRIIPPLVAEPLAERKEICPPVMVET